MKRHIFSSVYLPFFLLFAIVLFPYCGDNNTTSQGDSISPAKMQALADLAEEIMQDIQEIDRNLDESSGNKEEFKKWEGEYNKFIETNEPLLSNYIKDAGGKIQVPFEQTEGKDAVLIDEVSVTKCFINQKFVRIHIDVRGKAETDLPKGAYTVNLTFVDKNGDVLQGDGDLMMKPVEYHSGDNVLFRGSFDGLEKLGSIVKAVVVVKKTE